MVIRGALLQELGNGRLKVEIRSLAPGGPLKRRRAISEDDRTGVDGRTPTLPSPASGGGIPAEGMKQPMSGGRERSTRSPWLAVHFPARQPASIMRAEPVTMAGSSLAAESAARARA